ncbi:hypothetical protein VTN96DRAFT_654 [Rasamsonia emersonii]|uniref:C6 zinc finger domain protein n=1 Tax=Rasamsonia emersonii (strain ATCC 16479 / CBS 393.64 / IMI 116815) TaxID=1408163 RepID=A0A0F4YQP6_RASE3|nr:C6 zinc finger domain protein [Rasamsonia emersonii CBS 393.64]KKA20420.1 C6 zinc finger domain protein [Rasamsonia emersonii CBS 393.64]
MPTRRSHAKSRHGCLACKTRKVKCDEVRPQCSNCVKRQVDCEYASIGPILWTNGASSTAARSSTASLASSQQSDRTTSAENGLRIFENLSTESSASMPASKELNLDDLELMMQWCNSTYQTSSRDEKTDHIWRVRVPEEALSYPFLMHGILALSALHLARTSSDPQKRSNYLNSAISHQDQGLAEYRGRLNDINAANWRAMFVFSTIVTVYAFGYPHPPEWEDPWTPVDDLRQVLLLTRGVQVVLSTTIPWVERSEFAIILQIDDQVHPVPDAVQAALDRLSEMNDICAQQQMEHHDHEACAIAIEQLGVMFGEFEKEAPSLKNIAARWAIKVAGRYFDCLQARSPLALVILAHYCLILHRLREFWWAEGWSTRVLRAIWVLVDDRWRQLMSWVMEEVFGPGFSDIIATSGAAIQT